MKIIVKKRCFLKNEHAVSEEFTVIPALSIVMIGFALFVVLLAQTYTAYTEHVDQLQHYQLANRIFQKLRNPDCYFIRESGLIDLSILQNDTESLQELCESYQRSGIFFLFRLHWNNKFQDFPELVSSVNGTPIAVSKQVGIYLNEAQTLPGTLTLLLWRRS